MTDHIQYDAAWVAAEGSPVQFILPGEKGFAATQPIFECDAVMSNLRSDSNLNVAKYQGSK